MFLMKNVQKRISDEEEPSLPFTSDLCITAFSSILFSVFKFAVVEDFTVFFFSDCNILPQIIKSPKGPKNADDAPPHST